VAADERTSTRSRSDPKLVSLNRFVATDLRLSPLKLHKLRSITSINRKFRQIGEKALAVAIGEERISAAMQKLPSEKDSLILAALKLKYDVSKSFADKIQLLTIAAAAGISAEEIAIMFGASKYLSNTALDLYKEKGILSRPVRKPVKRFSESDAKTVVDFYLHDSISKMLPGRKDYVPSVHAETGEKINLQKRLLLHTLRTCHKKFKQKHPTLKCGWCKFTSLRPIQVVFPGSPGTLTTCVCMLHANPQLMYDAVQKLFQGVELLYKNCTDCVHSFMCNPPSQYCNFNLCDSCPGPENLTAYLSRLLLSEQTIMCSQWLLKERCTSEVVTMPVDIFKAEFVENLKKLQPHRFVVKLQHEFFDKLKEELKVGEVLVLCDYAENYSYLIQNAIQSNYWSNDQATLHVFVCLYRDSANTLHEFNYVNISDYHKHETKAVHLFQKKLICKLIDVVPFGIKKIIYFSDGSAAQYKNRFNFSNLMKHEKDFGMPAEWHFHATSHGKNLCDGIGGAIKRAAFRASHQKDPCAQIDSAKKLCQFANNLPKYTCEYTSIADHQRHNRSLNKRFKDCSFLKGCRSLHSFVPVSSTSLSGKLYSLSSDEILYEMKM